MAQFNYSIDINKEAFINLAKQFDFNSKDKSELLLALFPQRGFTDRYKFMSEVMQFIVENVPAERSLFKEEEL